MSVAAIPTAVRTLRQPVPYVYAFALGPVTPPIARVVPGETVAVEVGDIAGDATGADWFSARTPRRHPLAGPIWVVGAEPGDVLGVTVLDVEAVASGPTRAAEVTVALVGRATAAPVPVAVGATTRLAVERAGAGLVVGGDVTGRGATGCVRVVLTVDLEPGRTGGSRR